MSEEKREIGIELRSKLRNGADIEAIAQWAYELWTYTRPVDSEVSDLYLI